MTQRVIFLDRNAVDTVKRCVSRNYVDNARRQKLKRIDKRGNFISPMLSIIEGQTGQKEDEKGVRATLIKEAKAVGAFFKRAKTDARYLLTEEASRDFSESFSGKIEQSWDNYFNFIKNVHPLLHNKISKTRKGEIEEKLFILANNHGVPSGHPSLIISLAVLYGHEGARDTLKPKPGYSSEAQEHRAIYNVLSDVMVISRIGIVSSTLNNGNRPNKPIRFFSFDEGLVSVLNDITLNWERGSVDGKVLINCSYSPDLFPELDTQSYERLMKRLGGTPSY